eukprot:1863123-Amphidinium_carterae.1
MQLLGEHVERMKVAFQETLSKVHESGKTLLSAAGNVKLNNEVLFAAVPGSAHVRRRVAEEMHANREAILNAVQANGKVLETMATELGGIRQAVASSLRTSAQILSVATEASVREG